MEHLTNNFLKPPFFDFGIHDLGPSIFTINNNPVLRTDHKTKGVGFSLYAVSQNSPTVIYIPSYNSNRLEACSVLEQLLASTFNVLAMDLTRINICSKMYMDNFLDNKNGIITFGYYEFEQVRIAVSWLKKNVNKKIYLWGRSMGAVCAIKYQAKYGDASGIILDSPFHSLQGCIATKIKETTNIPKIVTSSILSLFQGEFKTRVGYNLSQMELLQQMKLVRCEVLFICNPSDSLSGESCELLYKQCRGKKVTIYTEADHSSKRQPAVLKEAIGYIQQLVQYQKKINKIKNQKENYFSKSYLNKSFSGSTKMGEDTQKVNIKKRNLDKIYAYQRRRSFHI